MAKMMKVYLVQTLKIGKPIGVHYSRKFKKKILIIFSRATSAQVKNEQNCWLFMKSTKVTWI